MSTKSLTPDRAIAIQAVWPTPRALVDAFAACPAEERRERMVERGVGGGGMGGGGVGVGMEKGVGSNNHRAKVGRALSRAVAEVWGGGCA